MAARPVLDPAVQHLLHAWGCELYEERMALGLSALDVARLVGLGTRLTADDVERCEDGRGSLQQLCEITEALGLGARVELVDADELRAEWRDQTVERELRRRQVRRAARGDGPSSK